MPFIVEIWPQNVLASVCETNTFVTEGSSGIIGKFDFSLEDQVLSCRGIPSDTMKNFGEKAFSLASVSASVINTLLNILFTNVFTSNERVLGLTAQKLQRGDIDMKLSNLNDANPTTSSHKHVCVGVRFGIHSNRYTSPTIYYPKVQYMLYGSQAIL